MATFVCRVGVPPGADRQLAVCLTSEPKARAAVGAAVRARLRIGSMVDEELDGGHKMQCQNGDREIIIR